MSLARALAAVAALLAACLLGLATPAHAQTIESVLSPGPLIKAHAKVEHDCRACHIPFERAAQDRLCTDCHKDVGADLRQHTGLHGRHKPQPCRNCHTDHRGRDAKVVEFEPKGFDHRQTDYPLRGAHAKVECASCHLFGRRWRDAASDCHVCHRKDDVHKGGLGSRCADCHNEQKWGEVTFDHDRKTRFALDGKHVKVACDDCHRNGRYKDTPRTCIGCHKKDDDHKGQYGERCDSCHHARAWKPSTFNHDLDTKVALRGKHRGVKCGDCHTGPLYRSRTSQECVDCHRKDDKHKDTLGRDCASCHSERGWKEPPRFDHEQTRFPLLGKHIQVECKDCHKDALYRQTPGTCIGCHRKDDKHKGSLGEACADCHIERDWKSVRNRFDHDKTRFALRNAHAAPKVQCRDCHRDLQSYRDAPMECDACHRKDDKHDGTLGRDCKQCHTDRDWRVPGFDHARTRFALAGRHVAVACKSCHASARYKEAPSDCWSCHKKEDKHKARFGTACQDCHNARAWALWDYDHARRARYALDGAHRKVACERCHGAPAPAGKAAAALATDCLSCHRTADVHDGAFGARCDACHVSDSWKHIRRRPGGAVGAGG